MAAMSKISLWRSYLFGDKTRPHRQWLKAGATGSGRIDLEEKNLTEAIVRGVDLTKARFVKCDLSYSTISSSDFIEAEITECVWQNSLLHSVDFDRASIEECSFKDTYFGITHFISTKVKGGDWKRSDLDKSTWTGAVVKNVCFQRVNLWRSKLHGAHFINCDFRDGNLMSVKADNAVFENCDFRGVYLRSFRFNNTKFINCGFHGCVGNPKFEGDCILIEPDLSESFDGTAIVEPEQLIKQWKSHSGQSQPETAIAVADSPQWLDYISKEHRASQVDWVVDEKMNGSPPMEVQGRDLSYASAYQAYFKAARFTDCDFTASDLRRSKVQQAKFISCTFDNTLLMYLDGAKNQYLDVKTSEVLFQDCRAKGAYFNRSELWIVKFTGGNWDGSYFNNCTWTCGELKDVSLENTDWSGAVLNSIKFINCSFKNAIFDRAELRAIEFVNCDLRGIDFTTTRVSLIRMLGCGYSGTKGMLIDIEPIKDGEIRITDADLSTNFDGSLVLESAERTQDLFEQIRSLNADVSNTTRESQLDVGEDPQTEESTNKSQSQTSQLKELEEDKQKLAQLRSQLKEVEERIKQARKTNIFGRKQSGENERERDKLMAKIKEIEARIAQNEASISNSEKS